MSQLLPRNNLDMDEKVETDDDTFAMDNAIFKLSLDDYTYNTRTIGHKSISIRPTTRVLLREVLLRPWRDVEVVVDQALLRQNLQLMDCQSWVCPM